MRNPLLTLTTDFGSSDHYVGAMKGAILSICPQARIVDITHEVTPYAITEAAYTLSQAYSCFPQQTIHVVVVDPGVGSERRPILVKAAGQYFVAPDNGVLSMIYSQEKHQVRHIASDRYFRKPVSRTFHGRDIFSPVAAHLAAGVPPARFGKIIRDPVLAEFDKPRPTGPRSWTGQILKIDRFGNCITNFQQREFAPRLEGGFTLAIGMKEIGRFALTYAEPQPGEPFVIAGSSGYLEVSLNQGSAARYLECQAGSLVELTVW